MENHQERHITIVCPYKQQGTSTAPPPQNDAVKCVCAVKRHHYRCRVSLMLIMLAEVVFISNGVSQFHNKTLRCHTGPY